MPTAVMDYDADRREAQASNERLDAKRIKIEREERAILARYPLEGDARMDATDVAALARADEDHTILSKAMKRNWVAIERAEAADKAKEESEDDKPDGTEETEDDKNPDEEMAADVPLGRGPSHGGASFFDIEQALVAQGPQKGKTVMSLQLPTMKFRGRKEVMETEGGERIDSYTQARFAGFTRGDLDLTPYGLEGIERLALAAGHGATATTAGLEFPEITIDIINAMWDVSRIQEWARVISTDNGNKIKPSVRTLLSGAAGTTSPWGTPNYEAEGEAIAERDPTYVGRELTTNKLAELNYQSYEVLRDHVPTDIRSNVVSAAMEWLGLSIGHECAVGSGANAPTGVSTELAKAANNNRRFTVPKATAAGDGVVTGDRGPRISDIQKGVHEIPDRYVSMNANDCAIFTSWKNGAHFRRLRVPESGVWYMERDPSGRTLGTVEGNIAVVTSPGFATFARDAKASAVFGAWSMFMLRYVGGPRIDFSWEFRFNQDQLTVRAIQEFDCVVLDPAAFWAFDCQDVA